ncbi:MAG: LysR family transcriptional regulator, partial [Luteimonas sp.]|nr:LysR family transcriptional regulator [Luteimonas sp.]
MDVASLEAFLAIAESRGFSAAGERLHLTQPAVSKRIAALEAQLGRRLFDRIGREVALTEAGQALLPRARRILAELDDTRRALDNLDAEVGGRLSLATSHHIGLHRLPPLLRAFSRSHPRAALELQFLDSEQAWSQVLHGRAELALTTLGPAAAPLRTLPVWDDPLEFVVARDHALAARGEVTLAELATHPAVLPDANTFTHRIVA